MIAIDVYEGFDRKVKVFAGMVAAVPRIGERVKCKRGDGRGIYNPVVRDVIHDVSTNMIEVYVR
jgi:hypothetical protein